MRIAVTSQNFRTVTGHAGKARRFLVFDVMNDRSITESERLDLPLDMAMHGFDDKRPHPLDGIDVLLTGGAGDGFVMRMARRGVQVVRTGEADPVTALHDLLAGTVKPPEAHSDAAGEHACGCHH